MQGHGFHPWSMKILHGTTEPTYHHYRSPRAWIQCPAAREATAMGSLCEAVMIQGSQKERNEEITFLKIKTFFFNHEDSKNELAM